MVLVDTSVWIDFLRATEDPKVTYLEALLEEGEAYLCEVTFAEICFGAKNSKQFKKYEQYFSELPFLTLPLAWHRVVAEMGFKLRRNGYKPYLADLTIAYTAIHHKVPLLTHDSDFKPYQELFGLILS